MIRLLSLQPCLFAQILRSRRDLLLENLALRQQLGVLKGKYPRPQLATADRKSTRLNSSHLGISYAVFCLKKTPAHAPFRIVVLVLTQNSSRKFRVVGLKSFYFFFKSSGPPLFFPFSPQPTPSA